MFKRTRKAGVAGPPTFRRLASLFVLGTLLMALLPGTAMAIGPTITGFTPGSGAVGTPVVITGTGLTSVVSVTFGGVPATVFTIDSSTQVTARVPVGAVDGPITVTKGTGGSATSATSFAVTLRHIVMIMMENHSYSSIVGSASAPYINGCLLQTTTCAFPVTAFPTESATQIYAVQHNSAPDYMNIVSGNNPRTEGLPCTSYTPQSCPDNDQNLVDQLLPAGLTWGQYSQDYPGPEGTCNKMYRVKAPNSTAPIYTAGHVPFMFFTDITKNPTRCTQFFGSTSVPNLGDGDGLDRLASDAAAGSLPTFSFVTPNEYTDMHQKCNLVACPPGSPNQITAGDEFLRYWVPKLMAGLGPYDEVIITWDESAPTDVSGCCSGVGGAQPQIVGGHIPTFVVLGSAATPLDPALLATPMDSFSLLAGVQNVFSLPGNIPSPPQGEEHLLNQPYATCGCTTPFGLG